MSEDHPVSMWTVYDHPTDYPEYYVARLFEVTAGRTKITTTVLVANSLDTIRSEMRQRGLVCMSRQPEDDPKIMEVWL